MEPAWQDEAPTELDPTTCPRFLEVDKDKLTIRYVGKGNHTSDVGAIQANRAVPRGVFAYYFELTVLDPGTRGSAAIGLAGRSFPLTRKPGWEPGSYGLHCDSGRKHADSELGEPYGPPSGRGDVLGCGLDCSDGSIFFTRNGAHLGIAFTAVPPAELLPTVGLHSPRESARLNFGDSAGSAPFAFDFEGWLRARRRARLGAMLSAPIGGVDVLGLVRAYCLHHAYARTHALLSAEAEGGGSTGGSGGGGPRDGGGGGSDVGGDRDGVANGSAARAVRGAVAAQSGRGGAALSPAAAEVARATGDGARPLAAVAAAANGVANGVGHGGGEGARRPGSHKRSAAAAAAGGARGPDGRRRAVSPPEAAALAAPAAAAALAGSLDQRQAIRALMLRGDVRGALALVREAFPAVLAAEPSGEDEAATARGAGGRGLGSEAGAAGESAGLGVDPGAGLSAGGARARAQLGAAAEAARGGGGAEPMEEDGSGRPVGSLAAEEPFRLFTFRRRAPGSVALAAAGAADGAATAAAADGHPAHVCLAAQAREPPQAQPPGQTAASEGRRLHARSRGSAPRGGSDGLAPPRDQSAERALRSPAGRGCAPAAEARTARRLRTALRLHCQAYTELVRTQDLSGALAYAQQELAPLRRALVASAGVWPGLDASWLAGCAARGGGPSAARSGADGGGCGSVADAGTASAAALAELAHLDAVVALIAYVRPGAGAHEPARASDAERRSLSARGVCALPARRAGEEGGASASGDGSGDAAPLVDLAALLFDPPHQLRTRGGAGAQRAATAGAAGAAAAADGVHGAAGDSAAYNGHGAAPVGAVLEGLGGMRGLLSVEQRERTADLLNSVILEELGVPCTSALDRLLQQLLLTSELAHEADGGRGERLTITV